MSRRKNTGRSTPSSRASSSSAAANLVTAESLSFWRRSLKRNDVELAAIDRLNHALHALKTELCDDDESILLALGEGSIRLHQPTVTVAATTVIATTDASGTTATAAGSAALSQGTNEKPEPEQSELSSPPKLADTPEAAHLSPATAQRCVDFLQRRTLRRKLLNRLFRRLLRVAATMDAVDGTKGGGVDDPSKPPAWPRYGEDPLVLTNEGMAHIMERVQQQQTALETKLVREQLEFEAATSAPAATAPVASVKEEEGKVETPEEEAVAIDVPTAPVVATSEAVPGTVEAVSATPGSNVAVSTAPASDAPVAVQPVSSAPVSAEPVAAPVAAVPTTTSADMTVQNEEAFLDYKSMYTRLVDPQDSSKVVQYMTNTKDSPEEEKVWSRPKVATVLRNMSAKEKEAEYERWKTAVRARIPLQPTFADLAPPVYCLKERKMAAAAAKAKEAEERTIKPEADESEDEVMEDAKDTKAEPGDDDSEEKDAEMTDVSEGAGAKKEEDTSEDSAANEKGKTDGDTAEEKAKDSTDKIVRPISLVPVPSFYEQDWKRIKLIQFDLMTNSMKVFGRRRTNESTTDYNNALRKSNDLNDRRVRLQNQLAAVMQENRTFLSKVQDNYLMQLGSSRRQWNKRREDFEAARLDYVMPHRNNPQYQPNGTGFTKMYANQPDPTRRAVAFCLGDIIDTAIAASEGRVGLERFQEKYCPPPKPDVQSNSSYVSNKLTEERLSTEYKATTQQLRAREEERLKAWKRMLKTRAEFDIPQPSQMRVNINNYHLIPLPSLRTSTGESLSKISAPSMLLPMDAATMSRSPMNTGPMAPPPSMGLSINSDSKYSAARVRERISSDGTVAPVTAPKRSKDGLYIRPAGRTRKGMEWDAIRGIWVPENNPQELIQPPPPN